MRQLWQHLHSWVTIYRRCGSAHSVARHLWWPLQNSWFTKLSATLPAVMVGGNDLWDYPTGLQLWSSCIHMLGPKKARFVFITAASVCPAPFVQSQDPSKIHPTVCWKHLVQLSTERSTSVHCAMRLSPCLPQSFWNTSVHMVTQMFTHRMYNIICTPESYALRHLLS